MRGRTPRASASVTIRRTSGKLVEFQVRTYPAQFLCIARLFFFLTFSVVVVVVVVVVVHCFVVLFFVNETGTSCIIHNEAADFLSPPQIVVQVLQALLAISFNISNNC